MSATVIAIADALDLLVSATQAAATIAPIIRQAQAEGRATLTVDEWAQIVASDDSALSALDAAIAKIKGATP